MRTSGRNAHGLVVQSADGSAQHRLPSLIESDPIPNTEEEIPTPAVAQLYSHLRDIEAHISPLEHSAEILLLIGRDLVEALHIHYHRIGPGWVIIGEWCLGGAHQCDNGVVISKTSVLPSNRPSTFTPCPNTYEAKE